MTELELHWLAGWLEGEGSFIATLGPAHPKTGTRKLYIAVKGASSDEDVIRRVAEVAGVGSVSGPYQQRPEWSPSWRWHVQRRDVAVALMRAVYPYMGVRRQQAIERALELEATAYRRPRRARG